VADEVRETETPRRRGLRPPSLRDLRGRLAARAGDMARAIRLGPVQRGLAGTVLLVLGSLTPAYLPQASPYWGPMRALGLDTWWAKAIGTALVIAAVALLISAWLRLREAVYEDVKHWAVLAWWSLPLLPAPPIFSHDAYSYAAQGWLIHNGFNPYDTSPSVLPGDFADQVSWVWRYTAAPYGPLALQLSHLLVDVAAHNPYYSAVIQRVPALVGVALIVHHLPRLGRLLGVDPRDVAWFSTINPLLVIDFVGGAHNDALMMGLLVWALHLAYRGRFLVSLLVLGVSMSVKQPALLAAYPIAVVGSGWASWHWRDVLRFLPRLVFAVAVVVAVFAGISLASGLGFGWLNAVTVPGSVVTLAPFGLLGFLLQALFTGLGLPEWGAVAAEVARYAGLTLGALLVVWVALTRSRTQPVHFLSWTYLIFAAFGPALHTWYLLWGGLLLPLTSPSPRVWRIAANVTAVLLVYGAGNLAWRNDALALALAGLAAAVLWLIVRSRTRAKETP